MISITFCSKSSFFNIQEAFLSHQKQWLLKDAPGGTLLRTTEELLPSPGSMHLTTHLHTPESRAFSSSGVVFGWYWVCRWDPAPPRFKVPCGWGTWGFVTAPGRFTSVCLASNDYRGSGGRSQSKSILLAITAQACSWKIERVCHWVAFYSGRLTRPLVAPGFCFAGVRVSMH